ncbi:metallophosphoesterase [Nocardia pseudovaccinii]|uniref:metallophosphoesterase n=1 Tax=Nocardia pseudovaccinii TaxID=189540 RepID=UPI000AC60FFE|nr:metallophosphoesterase [Nocardia pseudovaccinii]
MDVVVAVGIVVGAVVVVFGVVGVHWYLWRRLVRDTTERGSIARWAGTGVIIAGTALLIGAVASESAGVPFLLTRIIAWPGYMWGALFLYLVLWLVVGELVRPLLRRWIARSSEEAVEVPEIGGALQGRPTPVSRRLFVSRSVGAAATLAAVSTVGYGTHSVLAGPRVKRLTVPLANLPRAAHGFRITVVSDIHLGPILGRGFAERVVETINGTQPDLIAVVGDLVDGSVEHLRSAVEPLSRLHARHGAYFVTGNHEYFSGAEQWIEHVRELGLRLLANSRTELPYFDLAGVNDIQGGRIGQGPDFAAALGDRDLARTAVLLAHQPVQIHDAVEFGVDLQLSGHTHGGQLWPGNFLASLANPTVAGLERYGDTQLYVTRGAGAWGPPVRVGAPSDITVIELASTQA